MFDPSVGRWNNPDPIGFDAGDPNLYRYVGNQPTGYTDPSGLDRFPRGVPADPFTTTLFFNPADYPAGVPLIVTTPFNESDYPPGMALFVLCAAGPEQRPALPLGSPKPQLAFDFSDSTGPRNVETNKLLNDWWSSLTPEEQDKLNKFINSGAIIDHAAKERGSFIRQLDGSTNSEKLETLKNSNPSGRLVLTEFQILYLLPMARQWEKQQQGVKAENGPAAIRALTDVVGIVAVADPTPASGLLESVLEFAQGNTTEGLIAAAGSIPIIGKFVKGGKALGKVGTAATKGISGGAKAAAKAEASLADSIAAMRHLAYNKAVPAKYRQAAKEELARLEKLAAAPKPLIKGTRARDILRDRLGKNPYPVDAEAHHILGVELFDTPLGQRLHNWGIDLNSPANGMWLPKYDYPGRVNGAPALHRGRTSSAYTNEVTRRLSVAKSKREAEEILEDIKKDLLRDHTANNHAASLGF